MYYVHFKVTQTDKNVPPPPLHPNTLRFVLYRRTAWLVSQPDHTLLTNQF